MATTNTDGNYTTIVPEVNAAVDRDRFGTLINVILNVLPSWMRTRLDSLNFAGYDLQNANIAYNTETAYSLGNVSGALAIDYQNGHYQYCTAIGNITSVTISNLPASGKNAWLSLEIKQDATGSRTLTLGSAYKTSTGAAVGLTSTASATDIIRFESRDNGTTIYTFANLDMK